ncbi:MAG: hypothetical protein ACKO7W_06760 [Elainella sp.]
MVKAVAQLEQELAALDQTVAALAQAFHEAYQQYLSALGRATRQQLILASYHICTRGYPEQFTALSFQDQQTLQQTLRQLAKQAETELIGSLVPITSTKSNWALLPGQKNPFDFAPLDEAGQSDDAPDEQAAETESDQSSAWQTAQDTRPDVLHQSTDETAEPAASSPQQSDPGEINLETPGPASPGASAPLPVDLSLLTEALAARLNFPISEQASSTQTNSTQASSAQPSHQPLHPKQIAQWQSQLEAEIVEVLQTISHATNQVLQQTGILPNRLPEPILEVAAKADLSSETTASPPNLLNLLVEADAEDEKSALTQVIAIRLRLAEIEFGDTATAAQRSKLRHLMAQLAKLGREYQRKQKERAVAEAEAAWRTSWSGGE